MIYNALSSWRLIVSVAVAVAVAMSMCVHEHA